MRSAAAKILIPAGILARFKTLVLSHPQAHMPFLLTIHHLNASTFLLPFLLPCTSPLFPYKFAEHLLRARLHDRS